MAEDPAQSLAKEIREVSKDFKELMNLLKLKGLEVKKKSMTHKKLLKDEVKKLQNVSESLSSVDDREVAEEIGKKKQEVLALERELEQALEKLAQLEPKVRDAEQDLEEMRRQQQESKENKRYPRARYAVNLYREVSKISWHAGEQHPGEVKGFIRSKSNVKTFCFNEDKQSRSFITNNLWEMGEDEIW